MPRIGCASLHACRSSGTPRPPVAPPQRSHQLVLACLENGWLGQLHLGAPLARRALVPPPGPASVPGLREPGRRARRAGAPDAGQRRLPGPGARRRVARRVARPRPRATLAPDHRRGKPPLDGLPSTYTEADGEAETLEITPRDEPVRSRGRPSRYTLFAGRPSSRGASVRECGRARHWSCARAMSASLDLPDADWDARPADRDLGPRAAPRRAAPAARAADPSAASAAAPAHEHNPFLLAPRAATTEAPRRGVRRQPRLLAAASSRGRGRAVRDGAGPARDPSRDVRVAPGAGRDVHHARGGHRLVRRRAWAALQRRVPRPVPRRGSHAALARPAAAGAAQLLGGRRTSSSTSDRLVAMATRGRRSRRSSCSSSTTAGSAPATTTRPRSATGSVDRRKLPDGIDGLARRITEPRASSSGCGSSPRWSARTADLFRAHPDWAIGVPGRPRTESRQQLVLDLARPEVVDHLAAVIGERPRERADLVRQVGLEPLRHRAVDAPSLPADRQGEFFHRYMLGAVRRCTAAHDALPGHPVRVLRERRRPVRRRAARLGAAGLDQRRHRRRGAAARSSGARRSPTRCVDGRARLGRAEPPGRVA